MIRYPVTCTALRAEIDRLAPRWLSEAKGAHAKFTKEGHYSKVSLEWGDIKKIYMKLQFYKCAYCERSLEEYSVEHDVEHFRPKSSVKAWPATASVYHFNTGYSSTNGYFWLAYAPWNYATSCKSCNSALKANFFPIAGQRGRAGQSVLELREEEPFLIYPIGYLDSDPQCLITFDGIVAIPKHSDERNRRARVTIDFFRLNERDLLLYERAGQICLLGSELEHLYESSRVKGRRRTCRKVLRLCSADQPHAACKRAFLRLWFSKKKHASRVLDECKLLIESRRGRVPRED